MEVIEKFLFHCEYEKRLSSKTLKAYATDLKQFESYMKTHYDVEDISKVGKDELKHYIQFISTFKPKTTKRKIAATKTMFNFLDFEELIVANPFRKLRIRIKEPMVLPKVMNIQEVSQLFSIAYRELGEMETNKDCYTYKEKVRDVAVLELLFGTGVRVFELCSLRYNDIGIGFSFVRVNGKGNKERSIQIINEDIKKALSNYYHLFSSDIENQQFFFLNRLGNRLSEQSVRLMIKKYRNKCHITKNITPHMFSYPNLYKIQTFRI